MSPFINQKDLQGSWIVLDVPDDYNSDQNNVDQLFALLNHFLLHCTVYYSMTTQAEVQARHVSVKSQF